MRTSIYENRPDGVMGHYGVCLREAMGEQSRDFDRVAKIDRNVH